MGLSRVVVVSRCARPNTVFTARWFWSTVKKPKMTCRRKNQPRNPSAIPAPIDPPSMSIGGGPYYGRGRRGVRLRGSEAQRPFHRRAQVALRGQAPERLHHLPLG